MTTALLVSFAAFCLGPYIVWPSRWNIVGHISLGLYLVQYAIPLLWTDPFGYVPDSTIRLYTEIMLVGAAAFLLALPFGFLSPRFSFTGRRILSMPEQDYRRLFRKRVIRVTYLSTAGLVVSLAIMGYIPIFAANPLDAKYAHGEYYAGHLRAAATFVPSYFALTAYLPLFVVVSLTKHKWCYYSVLLISISVLVAYLNRYPIGVGIISGVGVVLAAKRGRIAFGCYLAGVIAFIFVGTLGNYLLSAYFALNTGNSDEQHVAETIAAGAPDISEGLRFFENFQEHQRFTYGAQFVAGFIPLKFLTEKLIPLAKYNPGWWAQSVLLDREDDPEFVRSTGGGGIRLSWPISGYAAFGWLGAVLMSAVAGFMTGYLARFAKHYVGRGSIEQSAIIIAMYVALGEMLLNPSSLGFDQVLTVIALGWLIYPVLPISLGLRFRPEPALRT